RLLTQSTQLAHSAGTKPPKPARSTACAKCADIFPRTWIIYKRGIMDLTITKQMSIGTRTKRV
ncbi:MAG: hypothetical protein LBP35_01335, partial [Candidatus Ancillula trichonymphae]|nr:hypothetical protein [Candidatus Ancillula trichonymphae]